MIVYVESNFVLEKDRDLDDPQVRQTLDEHGCSLKHRFDDGLAYLRSQLGR